MANQFFRFKQFTIQQDRCAMKVTTDSCLFGAWITEEVKRQKSKVKTILDIGTGTGLLSLMIAQKVNCSVTAIELDKDAFAQAAENINATLWKENIKIFHADIKDFAAPVQYDIVISNPPFYENEWQSGNPKKNIAHHSHELLLEELPAIISDILKPNGKFYLLLPYKRHNEITKLFAQTNMSITKKILVRQSEDHDYFRFMIEGRIDRSPKTSISEIAIRNKQDDYTKEFISLLKDYYLYM